MATDNASLSWLATLKITFVRWLDSHAGVTPAMDSDESIDYFKAFPFLMMHVACFAVIWVGWSWPAVIFALVLYVIRMFAITGIYHRYFSHRTFKMNRFWQFAFAVLGNSSAQRGPLWWAAHHRHHHRYSDEPEDIHSPLHRGFWWSHMFWFLSRANYRTRLEDIPDMAKFPELLWLDRFDMVVPFALGTFSFFFGMLLQHLGFNTSAGQLLVWFFISTICLAHGTFTINSLSHVFGWRRYETTDTSRNNPLLAIVTLGEGWHNNHHHYQSCARQGFRWYEYDITWYILCGLSVVGIVRDMKPIPSHLRKDGPDGTTAPAKNNPTKVEGTSDLLDSLPSLSPKPT